MSNQNKGIYRPGLMILFCVLSVALNLGLLCLIQRYNHPGCTSINTNNNDSISVNKPKKEISEVIESQETTPIVSQKIDRNRTLSGYFEKDGTQYPVVIVFHQYGNEIQNCVYKNINYGVKIKMSGFITENGFTFEANDHHNDLIIDVSEDYGNGGWTGYARSGSNTLNAHFEE